MGVPLDDTWIHFRFAENFANGHFFEFNIGEPTSGTTSPLWVILLAAFSFISSDYIFNSIFLSSFFYILSCIFIYKIAREIFSIETYRVKFPESYSLVVALLSIFAGRLAWSASSGMETTMFTFFCIIGVHYHVKDLIAGRFSLSPGIFFALATASRPEGYLIFLLFIIVSAFEVFYKNFQKSDFKKILISILLFIVVTIPYPIFSYYSNGSFSPNTYSGQGGYLRFIPNLEYIKVIFTFFFRDNIIVTSLFLYSVFFYFSRLRKFFREYKHVNLIFLWAIVLPVASSILIPNWRHHGRYMMPLIPFINFIGVFMFSNIVVFFSERKFQNIFSKKITVFSLTVFSFVYFVIFFIAIGKNTSNINDQQVKMAYWIIDNIPESETIAVNDIGAIGFITKRYIVDMAGLITPEILRYRTYQWHDNVDSTRALLERNNVKYLIIYEHWFKNLLNEWEGMLKHIHSEILEENTICGGEEKKVFKVNFGK
ncbi:MAG: hypothetical protein CDJEALGM_01906 [Ignavibacteria bacterium]|nr:hypothetical protein [Ignavibacteria bacterium]